MATTSQSLLQSSSMDGLGSLPTVSIRLLQTGSEYDASAIVFRFEITTVWTEDITINYTLFGTATAGVDYLLGPEGSLVIQNESKYFDLVLPVLPDAQYDPGETVEAWIKPSDEYNIYPGSSRAVAIVTADKLSSEYRPLENYVKLPTSRSQSNIGAFCMLLDNGQPFAFGDMLFGGFSPNLSALGEGVTATEISSSNNSFAAKLSNGDVLFWGFGSSTDNTSGQQYLYEAEAGREVDKIFSVYDRYYILNSDGSLNLFYPVFDGTKVSFENKLDEFVDEFGGKKKVVDLVVSDGTSGYMILFEDGSISAYLPENGNAGSFDVFPPFDLDNESENYLSIHASSNGFAALRLDHDSWVVDTWCLEANQTRTSKSLVLSEGGTAVVKIVSNAGAFAALLSDGSIIPWGISASGGELPEGFKDDVAVVDIIPALDAFCALYADGTVEFWGGASYPTFEPFDPSDPPFDPSDPEATGDWKSYNSVEFASELEKKYIYKVVASIYQYSALLSDGTVVTWMNKEREASGWYTDFFTPASFGRSSVLDIVANEDAFAAILEDGSVATWGSNQHGGDSSEVSSVGGFTGVGENLKVLQIYSVDTGFVALRSDGSALYWGDLPDDVPDDGVIARLFDPSLDQQPSPLTIGAQSLQAYDSESFTTFEDSAISDTIPIYGKGASFSSLFSKDRLLSDLMEIRYDVTAPWLNDGNSSSPGSSLLGRDYLYISNYIGGQSIIVDPARQYWFLDGYITKDGYTGIGVFLDDGQGDGAAPDRFDQLDELVAIINTAEFIASDFRRLPGSTAYRSTPVVEQSFTSGVDRLTGSSDTFDSFMLTDLRDSLLSRSVDSIIGLNVWEDRIDAPEDWGRLQGGPPVFLGSVNSMTERNIRRVLTDSSFAPEMVAVFTSKNRGRVETYLAFNDGIAGYQASNDAIINVTGYVGDLLQLVIV